MASNITTVIDAPPQLLPGGRILIRVTFIDNSISFKWSAPDGVITSATTVEQVKVALRAERDKAVVNSDLVKLIPVGVFDIEPLPDIPPTPEILARRAYGVKVSKFRQLTNAAVAGIDVQADIDKIRGELSALFIAGYEEIFGDSK